MEYWSNGVLRLLRIAPRIREVGGAFRAPLPNRLTGWAMAYSRFAAKSDRLLGYSVRATSWRRRPGKRFKISELKEPTCPFQIGQLKLNGIRELALLVPHPSAKYNQSPRRP